MTGAGPRIDVVVVDDDALVRAGLTLILGGAPDIVIVGEACDGQQVHDVVRRTSPRVVLMDIRMPYLDGVRATARLMTLAQPPQVIVLTTFDADEYVLSALSAGASGSCSRTRHPRRSSTPSARSPTASRCSPRPS